MSSGNGTQTALTLLMITENHICGNHVASVSSVFYYHEKKTATAGTSLKQRLRVEPVGQLDGVDVIRSSAEQVVKIPS